MFHNFPSFPFDRNIITPLAQKWNKKILHWAMLHREEMRNVVVFFCCDRVCKPGSVLTAIYLVPQLLTGSSHLLGAVGFTILLLHGVAPDRVYIVKPMSPWAGCALTAPFHPYLAAVYLCCTCPGVTPGGHYPLSLPCGARTFLT